MTVPRILLLLLLGTAARASAQYIDAANVPGPVKAAWSATFGGAVKWRAAPGVTFDAEFSNRGVPTVAHYSGGGSLIETRVAIGAITMPGPVRAAVTRDLKWYQLRDAWRVDVATGGTQYQVDADSAGASASARFAPDGRLLARSSHAHSH